MQAQSGPSVRRGRIAQSPAMPGKVDLENRPKATTLARGFAVTLDATPGHRPTRKSASWPMRGGPTSSVPVRGSRAAMNATGWAAVMWQLPTRNAVPLRQHPPGAASRPTGTAAASGSVARGAPRRRHWPAKRARRSTGRGRPMPSASQASIWPPSHPNGGLNPGDASLACAQQALPSSVLLSLSGLTPPFSRGTTMRLRNLFRSLALSSPLLDTSNTCVPPGSSQSSNLTASTL